MGIELKVEDAALHIGCGNDVSVIGQLCNLVKASRYILSDTDYGCDEEREVMGKKVRLTGTDGYRVLADEKVGFVSVSENMLEGLESGIRDMKIGCYLHLHAAEWANPMYVNRLGFERVDDGVFRKVRNYTQEDLDMAFKLLKICYRINYLKSLPDVEAKDQVEFKDSIFDDEDLMRVEPYVSDHAGKRITIKDVMYNINELMNEIIGLRISMICKEKDFTRHLLEEAKNSMALKVSNFYDKPKTRMDYVCKRLEIVLR